MFAHQAHEIFFIAALCRIAMFVVLSLLAVYILSVKRTKGLFTTKIAYFFHTRTHLINRRPCFEIERMPFRMPKDAILHA